MCSSIKYEGEFLDSSIFFPRYTAIIAKFKKIKEDKKVKKIVNVVHSAKGKMPNIFKTNRLIDIVNNTNENRKPKKDEYNRGL